jgi:23S rRNA pseudouridine1911/1915/1917 synthase
MVRLSKSRVAERSPWVRIPLSPFNSISRLTGHPLMDGRFCMSPPIVSPNGAKHMPLNDPEIDSIDLAADDEETWDQAGPSPVSVGTTVTLVCDTTNAGTRLDQFAAAQLPELTRSAAQRLIDAPTDTAGITVNGKPSRSGYKVRLGDQIQIIQSTLPEISAAPENIPLKIVYEDEHLLVINKYRGMVVHPAPGAYTGTLVNAVLYHCNALSTVGGETRPGIVHRLDKDTGGLIVVAKNDNAHRSLQAQIQAKTAERRYMALVWGLPDFKTAEVNAPIGRHPTDRKKMAVLTDARHTSRNALTELTVEKTWWGVITMLNCKLQTGRTHQIRVHCAYIKYPIVGDPLYGGIRKLPSKLEGVTSRQLTVLNAALDNLNGQALHAYSLTFDHPVSGERMHFEAPPAAPLAQFIKCLDELHS